MRPARLLVLVAIGLLPAVTARAQGGNPLGPEFRVNTYTSNNQTGNAMAVDDSGSFVVVWQSGQDGSSSGVFSQRFSASGAPLGSEFRVNAFTTGDQSNPAVASDPVGNFVVVWDSPVQDGSGAAVIGQRYASTGAPLGPQFRVNTFSTGYQDDASVAADSSGNFVVVWTGDNQDGSLDGVFGQRYASSGTPLGPEFRVNTYTTGNQRFPELATTGSGSFVVVWQSQNQDGSNQGVFGQRYSNSGSPLGPEFRANTYTIDSQHLASVAADSSGNFVVVWGSSLQDGSGQGIFGQRYSSSGAPLGPEFRVNTYTTSGQYSPTVAMDAAGNFVVVWDSEDQDGSSFGGFGQRYASSGVPSGPEFRVNTYTTNFQSSSSVDAEGAGNFVVTWVSGGQDGSLAGVFGQRYGQIVPVELMRFGIE